MFNRIKKCKSCYKKIEQKSYSRKRKFCSQGCYFNSKKGKRVLPVGYKFSEEYKRKMSQIKKGTILTKIWRNRISQSHLGMKKPWARKAGEKNPQWKGENVSYGALHRWVSEKLGKPKKCSRCKTTKAKKFEWANIGHTYKRVLSDYIRLCVPCHRKMDKQ